MPRYVLGTSAIMAFLQDEPDSGRVEWLVDQARADTEVFIAVPFVALMEVEYRLIRLGQSQHRVEAVLADLQSWPITIYESNETWRRQAAWVKATNRLSLADAWIASLALVLDAELVHKDPEMDPVPGLKALRLA
ncbi:MAG: PIN domain-containing protein [Chloroflexi bacterium]|nr:PIN domain-containing protein [Chloroflexota bacterium]